MKQYMVIESINENCLEKVYQRFQHQGRMLPNGLHYLDSWLEKDGRRCFQLMQTNKPELFDTWIKNWEDLTDFEIIEIGNKPTVTKS